MQLCDGASSWMMRPSTVRKGTDVPEADLLRGHRGCTFALSSPASAGIVPEKVLGGAGDQFRPSSNGTHLAWSQYRQRHYDVFVRPVASTSQVKVNAAGTEGWLGSFVQGTGEIVYQQRDRRRSDIYSYNVSSGGRTKLGNGISSAEWEWWPLASADLVMFLRDITNDRGHYVKTQLLLADRSGGPVEKLISDVGNAFVIPGYVGTDYVAWTRCARTCNVVYRQVDTGVMNKIPLPDGRIQYTPWIDEAAGDIYYLRSALRCGRSGRLPEVGALQPDDRCHGRTAAPGHRHGGTMSMTTNPDTAQRDLYFTWYDCARQVADVYVVRGADALSAPSSRSGSPEIAIGDDAVSRSIRITQGASPQHP
jgi:hypothetical protein